MPEDSKFPVSISGTIPEASVRRLAEGVADFISPITEAAGMLGDTIRGHREAAAAKRVQAAMQRAEKLGVLMKPAPVKFIASWSDAASLEADDSTLNRLWENLLIAGLSDYKSHLNAFVEILRKFGPDEARCLQSVIQRSGMLDVGAVSVPQAAEENRFPKWLYVRTQPATPNEVWANTSQKYSQNPADDPTLLGGIISFENSTFYFYEEMFHSFHVSFDLLRKEGLISLSTPKMNIVVVGNAGSSSPRNADYSLHLARLTQLGYSFAKACISEPVSPTEPK